MGVMRVYASLQTTEANPGHLSVLLLLFFLTSNVSSTSIIGRLLVCLFEE